MDICWIIDMKRILFFALYILCTVNAKGQSCIPDTTIQNSGIWPVDDSIPCIVQGQYYNFSLNIKGLNQVFDQGAYLPVDSITIDSILNLPVGLTWQCNKPSRTYAADEFGCITISGTTNEPVGEYRLSFKGDIYVLHISVIVGTNVVIPDLNRYLRITTGAGNCAATDTTVEGNISSNASLNPLYAIASGGGNLCSGGSTNLKVDAYEGRGLYTGIYYYNWSPPTGLSCTTCSNPIASPTVSTTYHVSVSDGLSTYVDSQYVGVGNNLLSFGIFNDGDYCGGGTGMAQVNYVDNGVAPFSYIWSTGDTGQAITSLTEGFYHVTVTDANGCSGDTVVRITDPCDAVWPGDANNDYVVDMLDLFEIYFAYGDTGTVRPNASINWVGQPSAIWSSTNGLFSTNNKFIDCNGDGVINDDDTLAIIQNYTLTHTKTRVNKSSPSDPVISLVPLSDTLFPNQSFRVKVILGSSTAPVDSILGIAFSVNLDPMIFDTSNIALSLSSSWLGTAGTNLVSIKKVLPSQGLLNVAIIRKDLQNANGYGEIGEIVLNTNPNFAGTTASNINFVPVVIEGLTTSGSHRTFNNDTVMVAVSDTVTGVKQIMDNSLIELTPNPNKGNFSLTFSKPIAVSGFQLLNVTGQQVFVEKVDNTNKLTRREFFFPNLTKGIYFLKIVAGTSVTVKRLVVE